MGERDVMATIVITKVDMFVPRVWHSVVVSLTMRVMCRQFVDWLIDSAVVTWNLQRSSLGFGKDDLPLGFSGLTCTVRSDSEVGLHHIVDDWPLGVQNVHIMATNEMIGEERFVLISHPVSEKR